MLIINPKGRILWIVTFLKQFFFLLPVSKINAFILIFSSQDIVFKYKGILQKFLRKSLSGSMVTVGCVCVCVWKNTHHIVKPIYPIGRDSKRGFSVLFQSPLYYFSFKQRTYIISVIKIRTWKISSDIKQKPLRLHLEDIKLIIFGEWTLLMCMGINMEKSINQSYFIPWNPTP